LLFRAIPRLLEQIPGGTLFGLGFFLCLYLASLGASVGLFETVVANLRDSLTWRRRRAVWTTSLLCLFLALFPALSSSYLASVSIFGEGILKTFDYVLVNWLLPTAALAVSLVVGHKLAPEVIEAEFKEASGQDQGNLFVHYRFILRFIVPSVILVALGLQLVDLLF
jgi:NSS family neurotransmitter:Na+ symporter